MGTSGGRERGPFIQYLDIWMTNFRYDISVEYVGSHSQVFWKTKAVIVRAEIAEIEAATLRA